MATVKFLGFPFNSTVTMSATQGARSDSYSTAAWGVPPAPVNAVLPNITGSSVIDSSFDVDDGEWSGEVVSYEYRLKLDGVVEAGIDSFPTIVLAAWDGKVPTFGVRAVGPGLSSAWAEVVGPAVAYAKPTFSVQPFFTAGPYTAGDTITIDLGTAGPATTLSVETFTLNGVSKIGELAGSGATRTWDSTGEPSGTLVFSSRATNTADFTISSVESALTSVGTADFFPTFVELSATAGRMEVIDLEGLGTQDSLTINSINQGRIIRRSDAKHSLDLTDFSASGTVLIGYTAVRSGYPNITGTCTVTMGFAPQEKGWGKGRHYYLPVDGSNQVIVEPGLFHRKIHISMTGLTKAGIEAGHPTANASGTFLRDNIVPVGLGGNGTWKYGEAPEVALDAQTAKFLVDTLFGAGSDGQSVWILYKRGDDFSASGFSHAGNKRVRGESALHPVLYGAYGSGNDPIIIGPEAGGLAGARFIVVQNVQLVAPFKIAQIPYLLIDGVTGTGEGHLVCGTNTIVMNDCLTIRRGKFTDISQFESKNASNPDIPTWATKETFETIFGTEVDSTLIEDFFVDVSGWGEGYTLDWSKNNPQPPTIYNHVLYLSGLKTDESDDGPAVNLDLTLRRSVLSRGSLTGFQCRPGGFVYENAIIGNNLGLMVGGAGKGNNVALTKKGNYSLVLDNVVTWAGHKTLQQTGVRAGGFTLQGKMMSVINNIICQSGPGNDGVNAHGTVTAATAQSQWYGSQVSAGSGGTAVVEDTKVYAWISSSENKNLGGLSTPTLDATTLDAWGEGWIGSNSGYRGTMIEWRGDPAPWTKATDMVSYFQTAYNSLPPAPGGTTTRVFRPEGRTPGVRWDVRLDWVGGVVPQAGDSVNLAGHRVNMFDNLSINALDMQGGELTNHGGKLAVTSISSGGTLAQRGSGQFWMNGYSGGQVVTVRTSGGRFRNAGTITGNMDFIIDGPGEVLFADSTGQVTIPAGRSITMSDYRSFVGFDGVGGGAVGLTIAGTLSMSSMMRLAFSGRDQTTATFGTDRPITGGTSGFTGEVKDIQNTGNATGFLYISDWTGTPTSNEPLNGVGLNFSKDAPSGQIGVAGAATYHMPQIAEFRSGINGLTATNVVSTVTLQGTSVLNLDVTGLSNATTYDLIVADNIVGTFGSVVVTGGTGTVAYTATKVTFTKTA